LALENSLALAEELGLLDAPAEQIVDSTPMLGAAATRDTVRLVRSGVKKLIDSVEAVDGEAASRLAGGLEFDYANPNEKPDCRWREKAERERILTRVALDAERTLRAVERGEGLLAEEAVEEACVLLRELVGQDFDVDEDGVPRLHRGTRQDRILSTVDSEIRHGRRSRHQRFDGYRLHAAATNTAEPLITAVEVAPANEQDGPKAAALVDSQPEQRRPERLLGDTAYGAGPIPGRASQARGRGAGTGARGAGQGGKAHQARLRDRSRCGHRHLPGRPAGEDPHPARRRPRRRLPRLSLPPLPVAGALPRSSDRLQDDPARA
jgi:hypothetical protein